jgi:hypothetical protein
LLANPALRTHYYDEVIAPTMALGERAFEALAADGRMRELDASLTTRRLRPQLEEASIDGGSAHGERNE